MNRVKLISAIAIFVLALAPTASPLAARPMTPEDIARLAQVREAAVSPDGAWIAYTVEVQRTLFEQEDGAAWVELHVVRPDGEVRAFVSGEVNVGDFAWTPDGESIAFLAKRGDDEERALWRISRSGGEAEKLLEHESGIDAFSFAPDGNRVVFLADEAEDKDKKALEEKGFDQEVFEEELEWRRAYIATVGDADGSEPRQIQIEGSARAAHWSPAGDRLVVVTAPTPLVDDDLMKKRVSFVDPESGATVAEVDHTGKLGDVAFSPDGKHLAMIAGVDLHDPSPGRLVVVPASGGKGMDLVPGFEGHFMAFTWKDGGSLYAIGHQGVEAHVDEISADGSSRRTLVATGLAIWEGISAAGGKVALTGSTPRHPTEVFALSATGADRVTDSNPWLAEIDFAMQEPVRHEARDGLMLEGVLIRPLNEESGKRYPLILTVHGGPEAHRSNGWLTTYARPSQVSAARGFATFFPNYRGSTGRGVEFSKLSQADPAGEEFDDLVDAVDHLVSTGLVDRDRVGITGGSYGGYATAWGSTYLTEHFRAGVMFVGISEKIAKWGTSDIPNELNWVHDRHWPWEKWDLMVERSPVRYAEQSRTALLILHGKEDTRVHPSQSLILYRYLKTLGKTPVRLVWYPKEGHGNRKAAHRYDYTLRMLRWFEKYLQDGGGEPPPPDVDYSAAQPSPVTTSESE